MERDLPWFAAMGADERSSVGLVVQAGIAAFAGWLRDASAPPQADRGIFGVAPRSLARAVSLQQTVQLIRVVVDVLEEHVPELAAPGEETALDVAVLRYSREVAFAAAAVYAAAAEARGAEDARVEAALVDALVRGDGALAEERGRALGWGTPEWVRVLVGTPRGGDHEAALQELRSTARALGLAVAAVHREGALVVVAAGWGALGATGPALLEVFGDGAVVTTPPVGEVAAAAASVREALAGLRAAPAWPEAPRPVDAAELLAERAVLGDASAREALLRQRWAPLAERPDLLSTVGALLDGGGSIEGAARSLFLHPNTVRYRLRKASELVGLDPLSTRGSAELRVALVLGRAGTQL